MWKGEGGVEGGWLTVEKILLVLLRQFRLNGMVEALQYVCMYALTRSTPKVDADWTAAFNQALDS